LNISWVASAQLLIPTANTPGQLPECLTTGWPCSEQLFEVNWHIQQVGNYYSSHT